MAFSMGESSCHTSNWEHINMIDLPEHIDEHGVSGIDEFFKAKLNEEWKDIEIHIGVTGDSGVGKSSFINAIRGLTDDDEGAAETGVKETTRKPAVYPHPTNKNIKFWDLPGIGSQNYPTVQTYWENVCGSGKYDTFLILTAGRFTESDEALGRKVKSFKKSFFFVRTKIDQDYANERRKKAFNEETMLKDIKEDCLENFKDLGADDEVVFLISNHEPAKWDFARLTEAVLDGLPLRQREVLTFSLDLLARLSKEILTEKVENLRGGIWKVAAASAAGAVVPVPGLSLAIDLSLLTKQVNLYKSQLGLPDQDSSEFRKMTPEIQKKVGTFCLTSAVQTGSLLAAYTAESAAEEFTRYIPVAGSIIAGGISFSSTYYFLHRCLNDMKDTAFAVLDDMKKSAVDKALSSEN